MAKKLSKQLIYQRKQHSLGNCGVCGKEAMLNRFGERATICLRHYLLSYRRVYGRLPKKHRRVKL